jgi:hypothetical protein
MKPRRPPSSKSPRHPAALLLVAALALALAPACASREGRTRGVFDPGGSAGADSEGFAVEGDYRSGANVDAAPMAVAETSAAPSRGLFDFSADSFEAPAPRQRLARTEPAPPAPPPAPPAGAPVHVASDAPKVEAPRSTRLVIYKGSLTVLVTAVDDAVEKLAARAQALGGYVENQSGNTAANNATVTLRVPAEHFHALVGELGSYGQVTQRHITASDVTKQVFDIELRLETAERSRQRLLDLLKTATKMEEILQIEAQVRRLTEEIEGMKGELRFLRDQVAFSTLAVTFYSNAPPPTPGPTRTRSRFEWINKVGIENVLFQF